jgi:hypothetical protein
MAAAVAGRAPSRAGIKTAARPRQDLADSYDRSIATMRRATRAA